MYQQAEQRRRPRRWPRNQQRDRVLQLVRAHDGATDAAELADQMGLHVTTVRFHLDALCEDGAIARTRIKRGGVGRPRTGYVAVYERLDYRSLAEVLALELGDTAAEREQRAERAGRRWAGRIAEDRAADDPHDARDSGRTGRALDERAMEIAKIFDRMGFRPELTPVTDSPDGQNERVVRLHGCPVRELARSHPEVSCGMHLGLLRGLLAADGDGDTADDATLRAELEPFVEPEMCIARVIADG